MSFKVDFEQSCRRNGIYTPRHMDGSKLREKWGVFQEKCPADYHAIVTRYPDAASSWEGLLHLYFQG